MKSLTQDEIKGSSSDSVIQKEMSQHKHHEKSITPIIKNESLLDILLSTKEQYDNTPSSLLKKKRKKKRKNHDL